MENSTPLLPAFTRNNIPIILASSPYYVPYMATTIQSIIDNSSSANGYDIIVLHKSIPEKDQELVTKMAEGHSNISIRFLKPDESIIENQFNYREDAAAASESFYCVLLQEMLPSYDKVICMDCDVIVLDDLSELYNTNIEGYMIAAAHDPDGIGNAYADAANKSNVDIMRGRAAYMTDVMRLQKIDDYFQSGVMLLNLVEFRKTYTVDEILTVACADYVVWGDQDTMNILCKDRVKYLGLEWNLIVNHRNIQLSALEKYGPKSLLDQYYEARKHPRIIHYAGAKPWKLMNVDLFPFFWEYAAKTVFYDEIAQRLMSEQLTNVQGCREAVEEQYRNRQIGLRYLIRFVRAWFEGKIRGKNKDISSLEQNIEPKSIAPKHEKKHDQCVLPEFQIVEGETLPIISVIIPCHNVQDYLKACVDSILWQSISGIEILLIDNVSTDGTPNIIREYADKYPNIKAAFLTEDMGPSGGRNKGIEMARGKYIAFCDADDTVPPKAYELMLRKAEKTHAEIVVGYFDRVYPDGEVATERLSGETPFEKCVNCAVVWNKLFRTSFLKNNTVRFDMSSTKARYGEDLLFVCQLLWQNPYIEILPEVIYKHLESRHGIEGAGQLTGEKMTYTRLYAYVYMVKSVFCSQPTHHLLAWRNFYISQLKDCFYQRWKKILDYQERKEGFLRLQELILLGKEKNICNWEEPELHEIFQQIFQMDFLTFQGMTFESYMLFLLLQHSWCGQASRENCFTMSTEECINKTQIIFREGKAGFRYIIKYIKAWLSYKFFRV